MNTAAVEASCCIVCYHNPPDQMERLLASVTMARPGMLVYLVDNSRSDALRALAGRAGAVYRHQPDNPGYARAHNWALNAAAAAGSRYHLVLNPDVQLPLDGIGKLRWSERLVESEVPSLVFEIGSTQADAVTALCRSTSFERVEMQCDELGLPRSIWAWRR